MVLIGGWFSLRYAWWRPAVSETCPRVLMYHMVQAHRKNVRFNGLRVLPTRFEAQLCWLRDQGWQGFTLSGLQEQQTAPHKAFVLTFDDGYEDFYHSVFPLLQRYGVPATLYLVVDRFDRDWSVAKKAHHNSGELAAEPKLSDEQVREILASGLVELGSHTLTHGNFVRMSRDEKLRELQQSRDVLQSQFGVNVDSFAYPFGLYSAEDPGLVQAAGYGSAVTTNPGIDTWTERDPYQLRRVKVSGKDSMLAFRLRMRGGRRGWKS